MTATQAPEEAKDMDEFDPSLVTADQVVALTKRECTAVLLHYAMPTPPAKWKLDEFRKFALATVMGNAPVPGPAEIPSDTEAETPAPAPEEAAAADDIPSEPGTALEARRPDGVNVFPDASRWQQLQSMAVVMAKSSLVPRALKDKPEDVTIILLAANDLGIPITQALDKIHVIDGKKGMAAELMIALALRDGHSITPDPANDAEKAVVHYRRRDNGDTGSVSFTFEDAQAAGLVSMKDGKPYSRNTSGKATPWEKFTADMLWARAVSRCMRRAFPDALAGVSYTPDELGYISADNDPVQTGGQHGEATVSLNEERAKLSQRASGLPKDDKVALVEEWRRCNYPRTPGTGPADPAKPDFTSLTPAAMKAIGRFIDGLDESRAAKPAEPDEAVVVEDGGSEGSNAPDPGQDAPEAPVEAAAVPEEPGKAPAAAEGSNVGVIAAEAGYIDPDRCGGKTERGCGEAFSTDDVIVTGPDGLEYHVGHEPL